MGKKYIVWDPKIFVPMRARGDMQCLYQTMLVEVAQLKVWVFLSSNNYHIETFFSASLPIWVFVLY
jgi:hypothetical protein